MTVVIPNISMMFITDVALTCIIADSTINLIEIYLTNLQSR